MRDDQNDDYLWDKSGPADPEVERLEQLLGGEGYKQAAPVVAMPKARRARSFRYLAFGLAAAAAAAVVALAVIGDDKPKQMIARAAPPDAAALLGPSWRVQVLAGVPSCVSPAETSAPPPCRDLYVGQWLETAAGERAEITVADIGTIQVEGGTRVRLVATGPEQHRMELAVGTLHAEVIAPPRLLVVDTPGATAVDLGCAYELTVDADGATHLQVTSGWVELEGTTYSAFVPAGAGSRSRKGGDPSTPVFTDAPAQLVEATAKLDLAPTDVDALRIVLDTARVRDTLTLWHLLQRVPAGRMRFAVLKRMTELAPRPMQVSQADLLALDPVALETYRTTLWGVW